MYGFFPGLRIAEVWTEPDPDRPGQDRRRTGVVLDHPEDPGKLRVRWDGSAEASTVLMAVVEPEDLRGPGVCDRDGCPLVGRSWWNR